MDAYPGSKRPFLTRRSGFSVCRRPVPGQQIVKPAHWMSAGHAFQHVLEIGEGLDLVELGGSDEGADGCPSGAAAVGSGKQVVLATERDRADAALDGIGVEFDAAIIEEAAKCAPAGQGVADRIGQTAAGRDEGELRREPGLPRARCRNGTGPQITPHTLALGGWRSI